MMHTAIVAWDGNNRVSKYQSFSTEAEANDHVVEYGGFIVIGGYNNQWLIDPVAKTVSVVLPEEHLTASKDAKYLAAYEVYIERILLVDNTKVRGSSAKDVAINTVMATISKGGPHKQAYEDLKDSLDALKDAIGLATSVTAAESIDVTDPVHWP